MRKRIETQWSRWLSWTWRRTIFMGMMRRTFFAMMTPMMKTTTGHIRAVTATVCRNSALPLSNCRPDYPRYERDKCTGARAECGPGGG